VKSPARRLTAVPILVTVTLLAYANSFGAGFALDNKALILQDTRVHASTRDNVDLILNHTYWWPIGESGLYRPVTTLSYLFNYAVLGNEDRPAGYHAFNLLLHVVNVILVFANALPIADRGMRIADSRRRPAVPNPQSQSQSQSAIRNPKSAIRNPQSAILIAALWAVHPLSTEAVTNIVGRADLLAAFAVLSGLLMYVKSSEATGARRFLWLALLAATTTLGVFAKESAVVIVAVIALYRSGRHPAARGPRRRGAAAAGERGASVPVSVKDLQHEGHKGQRYQGENIRML
jgi:protein O-mannosyl-transferase